MVRRPGEVQMQPQPSACRATFRHGSDIGFGGRRGQRF